MRMTTFFTTTNRTKLMTTLCLIIVLVGNAFAQKTDGTVNSLIEAESYFSNLVAKDGLNKAIMKVAGQNGVVFRPNPVNTIDYYSKQQAADFELAWQPDFAMISKSGYFGFTTGLFTYTKNENITYGQYLSVWKADKKKKWQLMVDAGTNHKKPTLEAKPNFINPTNFKYPKLIGPKKIKMREDIVFSTDLLFGKALERTGNGSFMEYYADNVRLLLPGTLPINGKNDAIKFIDERNQRIASYPTFTDRAISGDLAYTNGKASVGVNKYDYIRIWQIGEDMKWYILVDMYVAE